VLVSFAITGIGRVFAIVNYSIIDFCCQGILLSRVKANESKNIYAEWLDSNDLIAVFNGFDFAP
jgi:hypothetical protein